MLLYNHFFFYQSWAIRQWNIISFHLDETKPKPNQFFQKHSDQEEGKKKNTKNYQTILLFPNKPEPGSTGRKRIRERNSKTFKA